jgi:hypothetical protein
VQGGRCRVEGVGLLTAAHVPQEVDSRGGDIAHGRTHLYRENPFSGGGARGEDGTSKGGSGACRPKKRPEPLESTSLIINSPSP